jgi:hypothetical protein
VKDGAIDVGQELKFMNKSLIFSAKEKGKRSRLFPSNLTQQILTSLAAQPICFIRLSVVPLLSNCTTKIQLISSFVQCLFNSLPLQLYLLKQADRIFV